MSKILLTSLASVCLFANASAAEWGTITGQIVLDGDAPKPVLLHAKGAAIKDSDVCAAEDVYSEDLVVDPDTKGIANIFVYLYKAPSSVHPESAKPAPKVIFDQKNCVFKPRALVVQAGQTVEVLNDDSIAHNTHTYPLRNDAQNILIAPMTRQGDGVDIPTRTRESLPHEVKCDYHPWMKAYWLVVDHPYAAATDKSGKFKIENLPVGEHTFRVWHPLAGYLDRAYKVTVAEGKNPELKPVTVKLSQFED